jgi:tectonic-1/3
MMRWHQNSGSGACDFYECPCGCDLTAGACDAFCCCDPECSETQVAAATDMGLCIADAVVATTIEYCSTDLSAAGQRSSLVSPLVTSSLLCVAVDNNEVVGEFYASLPEEDMAVATAFLRNPKPLSFTNAIAADASTDLLATTVSTTNVKSAYEPGDLIKVFLPASSSESIRRPVLTGFGPALGSNECWDGDDVRFLYDKEAVSCVRRSLDLLTDCEDTSSPLSVTSLVSSDLLVARWPNVTTSSVESAADSSLTMTFQVRELATDSNELVALDESALPSYFPHPELGTDEATNASVCRGVLQQLHLSIEHDGAGHLTKINAVVVIGSVEISQDQALMSVAQTFSMQFTSSRSTINPEEIALTNGNLDMYARSGNPGYLMHLPVRVGVTEDNTTVASGSSSAATADANAAVISEMAGGLQLPGLGDCNIDVAFDSSVLPIAINFGEDSQTSCSLTLTTEQFEALCSQTDALLPALQVNFTHVARFGNSDPYLTFEWLELDYDSPTKNSAVFVRSGASDLQCQSFITGLHLEFLVGNVGPAANPQRKIVAARASHSSETWRFWASGDANRTATFFLYTSVNFVWANNAQLDALIPEPPPVWFAIPSDVFYPFMLNSARSSKESSWTLLVVNGLIGAVLQRWHR